MASSGSLLRSTIERYLAKPSDFTNNSANFMCHVSFFLVKMSFCTVLLLSVVEQLNESLYGFGCRMVI